MRKSRTATLLLALLGCPTAALAQETTAPPASGADRVGIATGPAFGSRGYRLWNLHAHFGLVGRILLTGRFAAGSRLVILCYGVDDPQCDDRAPFTGFALGLQLVLGRGGALEPYLGAGFGGYSYGHPAGPSSGGLLSGEAGLRYRFASVWGAYAEVTSLTSSPGLLPFFGAGVFLRSP